MHVHKLFTQLLVDPVLAVRLGIHEALLEPQSDLSFGALDAVRAVADVATHVQCEVAADRAGCRVCRVGGAQHRATSLDGVPALPDHADYRPAKHVL